jgi:hypothetical protein
MKSFLCESRVDDLDRALANSALRYGSLGGAEILDLVDRLELVVFWAIDPSAQPFHCPSGPGVDISGAEPGVAQVYKYVLRQDPNDRLKGPLVKFVRK